MKSILSVILLLKFVLITSSCSGVNVPNEMILIGSTPGHDLIKSMLSIAPGTKVDFIRWNLELKNSNPNQNDFILEVKFGEGKQGTPDFIGGGEKKMLEGTYIISKSKHNNINGEIYTFKSKQLFAEIAMVKLTDNLFHLLTPEYKLMVGNGGWSYTLNRKVPVKTESALPVLTASSPMESVNASAPITFEGRTPCQEFAADHKHFNASSSCMKLKWRVVLNRDPDSHQPTTYSMLKVVDNQPGNVSGKWKVIKGTASNPQAVIYQLNPDKPDESISFLVGDENILFFLDKKNTLYIGDSEFSYTLNRIQPN